MIPNEIEDAMWVTREEMALAFAGNHPKLLPARKGAIAHFLLENWLRWLIGSAGLERETKDAAMKLSTREDIEAPISYVFGTYQ